MTLQQAKDLASQSPARAEPSSVVSERYDRVRLGNDTLAGLAGGRYLCLSRPVTDSTSSTAGTSGTGTRPTTILCGCGHPLQRGQFSRVINDLVIDTFGNSPGASRIRDGFRKKRFLTNVKSFVFADGVILTLDDVKRQVIAQSETDGDDASRGSSASTRLQGGSGDDSSAEDRATMSTCVAWRPARPHPGLPSQSEETNTLVMHGIRPTRSRSGPRRLCRFPRAGGGRVARRVGRALSQTRDEQHRGRRCFR